MIYLYKNLSDTEFKLFAELVHKRSGIYMKESKNTLLSNRLKKRLKALGFTEYLEYYDYLQNLQGKEQNREFNMFFDVVSTHETFFFRHEHNFETLLKVCLPEIAANKKYRSLRIWSAACSTGEEPYSIAMCVLENIEMFRGWNIEILATDISRPVLEAGKIGRFHKRRMEKVPPNYIDKYFTLTDDDPDCYEIKPELTKLVKFYQLNFFEDTFPRNVDIIFCRNAMIYFDKEYQKRLVKDFHKIINKNGFLFVGYAETLYDISNDFEYKKILSSPVYIPKQVDDE